MVNAPRGPAPAQLADFLDGPSLTALVKRTRDEDLGPYAVDITSGVLRDGGATASAFLRAGAPGTLAGLAVLPTICRVYGAETTCKHHFVDGGEVVPGDAVATVTGPLATLLALERVALNFITWLSGIATLTAHHTAAVAGTGVVICDTRKTHPGLRPLEKYAVTCGGGFPHRMGLYDAALLKDNHLADIPLAELTAAVDDMVRRVRANQPPPRFVAVEVDTLEQLHRILDCTVDIILLDNMTIPTMHKAVAMRTAHGSRVLLEASGGITMANVGQVAATGVDRISIGALTHSAAALDFTMEVDSASNRYAASNLRGQPTDGPA